MQLTLDNQNKSYKTFLPNGEKKGNFHLIGDVQANDTIYIAEGYATGVSIYTAKQQPVVIAFDAGNISYVTENIKYLYPNNRIIITADNDPTGISKAKEASEKYQCEFVWPSFPENENRNLTDFNDLHQHYGIEEVKKQIHIDLPIVKQTNQGFDFNKVVKSLSRNERGDSELFIEFFKDKYVFDSSEGKNGEFYYWNESCWTIDRERKRLSDIENIADLYEKASNEICNSNIVNKELLTLSSDLKKRAFNLRSSKRCKSVFEFVASESPLKEEWDYCPYKLPCVNGIVDLKTGEITPNKPNLFIRNLCPTQYNPSAKRDLFEKFLDDITLGDKDLNSFLKRMLGYALLGVPKEEKIFIFYGKDGRNGKGTLMQTLEKVLESIAKTFSSEMILLQRNPPSSSTPRPEKANLQGTRFAIFSEIDEHRRVDASEIKNLSGGDTITCRRLFSNIDIQIRPSHTMIIQTNFKPKASAKDGALWKRNILVPFNAEFVDEPDLKKPNQRKKEEGFKEKLLLEKEGILNWLIEGCLEYQKIGLSIPKIIKDETENYRKENDGIQLFIEEFCILDSVFTTPKSKMTLAIQKYCRENQYEIPNRIEISNTLKEKFKDGHSRNGDHWCGIKIVDKKEFQGN